MENLSKDKPLRVCHYQAVVAGVSAGGLKALNTLLATVAEEHNHINTLSIFKIERLSL